LATYDGRADAVITFRISRPLKARWDHAFPWGTKARILMQLIDLVTTAVEKDGSPMIGALLSGDFQLTYLKGGKSWEKK